MFYEFWRISNRGFPGGSDGKEYSCHAGELGSMPRSGRSLEKRMATHSSILTWEISWTKEPGRRHHVHKELNITEQLILSIIILSCTLSPSLCSMNFDKFIITHIYQYNITQSSFSALKILHAPPVHPSSQTLVTTDLHTVCHAFAFSTSSSQNHTV